MATADPNQARAREPSAAAELEPVLRIDDDDRYGSLRLISWWRQERLERATVLVVGAGALGNEVIKNLALVGVGTIRIVDFDTIENANLARSVLFRPGDVGRAKAEVAAARARELNPDVRVQGLAGDVIHDVGLGTFLEADVVIGCLDNREARLWVNRQCWKTNTPWVDAGIQEIQGAVKIFVPPDSACYECGMTDLDYRLLNLRYSCPLLRREDLVAGKVPTAPTIASIMGALQVQEALKILHDLPVSAGAALVFNGVTNLFYEVKLPNRADCLSHETYPEPERLGLGCGAPARALFEHARGRLGQPLALALTRELVTGLACPRCGWSEPLLIVRQRLGVRAATCPQCQEPALAQMESEVGEDGPLAARTLAELGFPPYDVVRVDGPGGTGFYLLAGDRALQPREAHPSDG